MEVTSLIDQYLENRNTNSIRKRSWFYPSEAAATQQELFSAIMAYGYKPARTHRVLDNGTDVHNRLLRYLEAQGMVKAKDVEITDALFHGRADALISLDGKVAVLEIKSMNRESFNRLENIPDAQSYWQVQLYMHFLKVDYGVILVECKDDQRLKEFHVSRKYKAAKEIIDRFSAMKEEFTTNGMMGAA